MRAAVLAQRVRSTPLFVLTLSVGAVLLALQLIDVLLLVFGAILFALLLDALAGPLQRRGLPRPVALCLSVAGLTALAASATWVFGRQAMDQLRTLTEILPGAWADLQARLATDPLGRLVLAQVDGVEAPDDLLLRIAPQVTADLATGAAAALIVSFAGLYIAFHPQTYLEGALKLVPRRARPRALEVVETSGAALRRWLLGQLVSMVLVGTTTGVGLWLAGIPTPLGLGLLSGVGQFVPVVGPMVAAVPGLVVALTEGPEKLAWALLVYLGAAQLEANLITPLILRKMAQLPMAVTLFAVLALGLLLGPLGVLFATPLAVVAYVAVKMLYVEDLLGEPADRAPGVDQGRKLRTASP